MKTAILTDSGSAMTPEQAKEAGIYFVPLQVIDGDQSYRDGVDITTSELYDVLRKNHTPKTSMPLLQVIQDVMQQIKEDGYEEIIALPLSSGLSSTYNSMQISAQEIGIPINIIENYTTCDLQGYGALLAKKLIDEGKSSTQVKEFIEGKVKTSGTLILPNDIQHLKRGGRLTPIAAAAASLLKIKPILIIGPETMGKIDVFDKVRTEHKATNVAIDYISEKMKDKRGTIYVIHSDNLEKARQIQEELQNRNANLDIHINYISAVIAAHTGLDCIAIQYIEA